MELAEIYKKFREIAEELNEQDKIRIEQVRFNWCTFMDNTAILTDIEIATTKQG